MIIRFRKPYRLPVEEVFSYFRTPADWSRLYGLASDVRDLGDGWFAVPLHRFPFPLVARNTVSIPNEKVHWVFRGFWQGEGEVRFSVDGDTVTLDGYERISVRWLFFLSPLIEKLFLEKPFRAIWELGWRRLAKAEASSGVYTPR